MSDQDLTEVIKALLLEISSLKKEISELKKNQNIPDSNKKEIKLHSIKKDSIVQETDLTDDITSLLDKSVEYAIKDFKLNPPKYR